MAVGKKACSLKKKKRTGPTGTPSRVVSLKRNRGKKNRRRRPRVLESGAAGVGTPVVCTREKTGKEKAIVGLVQGRGSRWSEKVVEGWDGPAGGGRWLWGQGPIGRPIFEEGVEHQERGGRPKGKGEGGGDYARCGTRKSRSRGKQDRATKR